MSKEINDQIMQLVRQRNELQAQAAAMQFIAEMALGALDEVREMCPINEEMLDKLTADVKATPAQSLAEHDAALLERLAAKLKAELGPPLERIDYGFESALHRLEAEADEIRQEAST